MRVFKSFLPCLFLMLCLDLPLAGTEQPDRSLAKRIDAYLVKSAANNFSGAVLVAREGEIILSKGYGLADRKNNTAVVSSTIFNIGSVTKQFTAAAILKLAEQEKLKTSDTLGSFFENVPADKKDITVHQLLTHTAGISPNTGGPRYDLAGREKFLREFFDAELAAKPGTEHQYANAGYIVLAALVEIVSGQRYETFLYEQLFKPAGMMNTGYKRPEWNKARLAHGYYFSLADADWADWGTTPDRWVDHDVSWYGIGKGDLHSSVEDLYKWHEALQANSILSAKTRARYETPYVRENPGGSSHYAYGWAIFNSERNTKIVAHDGSNGVFFANFIRFVEEDVVVIFLTNVALGKDIGDAAWEIARVVFDPDYEPRPIPRLNYELVYQFMKQNKSNSASELSAFMLHHQGKEFRERRVLNQIGFQLVTTEKCDWALALLKLNTRIFPDDGNLFDSLGEASMNCEQLDLAVKSFFRALELAPADGCFWCDNSRQKAALLAEKTK